MYYATKNESSKSVSDEQFKFQVSDSKDQIMLEAAREEIVFE